MENIFKMFKDFLETKTYSLQSVTVRWLQIVVFPTNEYMGIVDEERVMHECK